MSRLGLLGSSLAILVLGCGPGVPGNGDASGTSGTGSTAPLDPTSTGSTSITTTSVTTGLSETSSVTDSSASATTTGGTTSSATGNTTGGTTESVSSSTGGGSSSTGGPVLPEGCPGGEPMLQAPEFSENAGLEWCSDGQIHRHTAVECLHPLEIKACLLPNPCGGEACDDVGDGLCNAVTDTYCGCQYPCTSDSDCPADSACLCNSAQLGGYGYITFTECVPANCRTDADCGDFLCALSPGICGYGWNTGLFCHTAADECISGEDCIAKNLGNLCMFEPVEERWKCTEMASCE